MNSTNAEDTALAKDNNNDDYDDDDDNDDDVPFLQCNLVCLGKVVKKAQRALLLASPPTPEFDFLFIF